MEDIFGICNGPDDVNSFNYVKEVMDFKESDNFKIDYPNYIYTFNKDPLTFNDNNKDFFVEKIIQQLDNSLGSFFHINKKFRILHDVNVSYNYLNFSNGYQTISILQNYYLELITDLKTCNLADHWFNGIFNNIILDEDNTNKTKSKYHRGIEILKKYLINDHNETSFRNKLITQFLDRYIEFSNKYFIKNITNMSLLSIFEKISTLNNINKIFLELSNQIYYLDQITIKLIPFYNKYINEININEKSIDINILKHFNRVNLLNTNFKIINFDFVKQWHDEVRKKISINHYKESYKTSDLFNYIKNICPLITVFNGGHNMSDDIMGLFKDVYKFENNLYDYILTGLNVLIKNIYKSDNIEINDDITNILNFISIYQNRNNLWKQYFITMKKRVNKILKSSRINDKIINFELKMYNLLQNNDNNEFITKTNMYLNNIQSSITNNQNLNQCKINYQNTGENFVNPDLSKVDYITFDKNVMNIKSLIPYNYNLIDASKYPTAINNYYTIGQTYYSKLYENRKFDWDIENSSINFNIQNCNMISNIIQFTMIDHIKTYKALTKDDLIIGIVNKELNENDMKDAKLYLESYLNNLISKNIVKLNGSLTISKLKNNSIDISSFKPSLTIETDNNNNDNKETVNDGSIIMTDCCLSYLRIILLIKMFKTNSTKTFKLKDINNEFKIFIDYYIASNKFCDVLKNIIMNLPNVSDNQLINEISDIEKRDIIEKVSETNNYRYVV